MERRKINNDNIDCIVGDYALICSECFHLLKHRAKIYVPKKNFSKYTTKDIKDHDYRFSDAYIDFVAICPECGSKSVFFNVDSNMGEIISFLNKHGITTEYSCQGHSHLMYGKRWKDASIGFCYDFNDPYIVISIPKFKNNDKVPSIDLLEPFLKSNFNHIELDFFEDPNNPKEIEYAENKEDYVFTTRELFEYRLGCVALNNILPISFLQTDFSNFVDRFKKANRITFRFNEYDTYAYLDRITKNQSPDKVDELSKRLDNYFKLKCKNLYKNLVQMEDKLKYDN